jgi:hypothetical protein
MIGSPQSAIAIQAASNLNFPISQKLTIKARADIIITRIFRVAEFLEIGQGHPFIPIGVYV